MRALHQPAEPDAVELLREAVAQRDTIWLLLIVAINQSDEDTDYGCEPGREVDRLLDAAWCRYCEMSDGWKAVTEGLAVLDEAVGEQ